jgi:putative membrane protein
MDVGHMRIAFFLAAAVVMTPVVAAQVDPSANPSAMPGGSTYPTSPGGTNQPTTSTGAATTPGGASTPSGSMRDSLGAPGETGQQMMDQQFVRKAVEIGMGDVKLATLATQKGGPEVKDLAQKLAEDHTAMNKDLLGVADSMGVMVPKKMSKPDQAEYEKLNGLSGKDFDTEYLSYITRAHWETMHSFYMEASVAAEPALQSEVVKSLSTMHQHLGLISKTATAEGITLPPRPPRPTTASAAKP